MNPIMQEMIAMATQITINARTNSTDDFNIFAVRLGVFYLHKIIQHRKAMSRGNSHA